MSPFALAVQARRWRPAALYLLVAALEAVAALAPPERALLLEAVDAAGR